MQEYHNFIDGKFVPSSGKTRIEVTNPSTGQPICTVPESSDTDLDIALSAAEAAQRDWAKRPAIERAKALRTIADKIRERRTSRAGHHRGAGQDPRSRARRSAFTADYFDYMAEWARRIEGEILESDRPGETIFLFRQPIGVIGGILPWNFPFFLIARKAAPALVTGNTIVIKPSEETPHNAVKFCELLAQTDLPPGVINIVHGRGATVGKALASSPRVGMISFTGSVETGSAIMSAAAANITKVNLELGGKAPAIVMGDADLELAVEAIKASRVINSGQVCNCAERVYVQRKIAGRVRRETGEGDEGDEVRQPAGGRIRRVRPADQRIRFQQGRRFGAQRRRGGSDRGDRRQAGARRRRLLLRADRPGRRAGRTWRSSTARSSARSRRWCRSTIWTRPSLTPTTPTTA